MAGTVFDARDVIGCRLSVIGYRLWHAGPAAEALTDRRLFRSASTPPKPTTARTESQSAKTQRSGFAEPPDVFGGELFGPFGVDSEPDALGFFRRIKLGEVNHLKPGFSE